MKTIANIINVRPDGNCFYHAINLIRYKVRNELINYCLSHLELFDFIDGTEREIMEFINAENFDGVVAQNFLIEPASNLYNYILIIWNNLIDFNYVAYPKKLKIQNLI